MSTLLEKPIRVNRIVTVSPGHARAIEDPSRSQVIKLLYRKSMCAEQIASQLRKSGYKKALTTIRHHLDILKEAGLIEVVRIEESRGAITKYYGTSTKLLGYNAPEDFDAKYSSAIKSTSKRLEEILDAIAPKASQKSDPQYSQYVVMEIMNRAMTQVMEKGGKTRQKKR